MADLSIFDPMLNWKLLEGSHPFPSAEGGTCINEAAIVAAGFKYRTVSAPWDCPICFSRVISGFALYLNDVMDDEQRQTLLPFVVRLAGSADTPKVERKRGEFIVLSVIRRILPLHLGEFDYDYTVAVWINLCKNVRSLKGAYDVLSLLPADDTFVRRLKALIREMMALNEYNFLNVANEMAIERICSALEVADVEPYKICVDILDKALKIGKQAEPIETELVIARLEKAKQLSDSPV